MKAVISQRRMKEINGWCSESMERTGPTHRQRKQTTERQPTNDNDTGVVGVVSKTKWREILSSR